MPVIHVKGRKLGSVIGPLHFLNLDTDGKGIRDAVYNIHNHTFVDKYNFVETEF